MPEYVEKISENDGYHVKGDFLKVEWKYNYQNNVTKGKSLWVAVAGNHFYNADKLIPRTKEEYDKAPAEHKPHC